MLLGEPDMDWSNAVAAVADAGGVPLYFVGSC